MLAKSPSLAPRPVKSNRNTAIPLFLNLRLIRVAACTFLLQVKQCAKIAKATGFVAGSSSLPESCCDFALAKLNCWVTPFMFSLRCPLKSEKRLQKRKRLRIQVATFIAPFLSRRLCDSLLLVQFPVVIQKLHADCILRDYIPLIHRYVPSETLSIASGSDAMVF